MSNPEIFVEYDLTLADFRAMLRHLGTRARPPATWRRIYFVASVFCVSVLLGFLRDEIDRTSLFIGALLASVAIGTYALLYRAQVARRFSPTAGGFLLRRYAISLDAEFIHVETALSSEKVRWFPGLLVEETPTHIFIVLDAIAAFCIPRTAFADLVSAARFVEFARSRIAMTPVAGSDL